MQACVRSPLPQDCKRRYERERYRRQKASNTLCDDLSNTDLSRCRSCRQMLPLTQFMRHLLRTRGRDSLCRPCAIEYKKQRRSSYKVANKDLGSVSAEYPEPTMEELENALSLETAPARNLALRKWGRFVCPACEEPKRYTEFHRNRCQKYGIQTRCKLCAKAKRSMGAGTK